MNTENIANPIQNGIVTHIQFQLITLHNFKIINKIPNVVSIPIPPDFVDFSIFLK